jgi:hypothetical protein
MRDRHRFRPAVGEPLEGRRLLSAKGLVTPVVVKPLPITRPTETSQALQATTAVNQDFDAFTQDYLQAQATYLASPGVPPGTFSTYITQRVELLSQDLVKAFTPLPGSLNRLPGSFGIGGSIVLQAFLRRVIVGPQPGTLLSELRGNIPVTGLTGPAATLVTLNATTAIATARTATLNSVNFLLRHTFHNGHPA